MKANDLFADACRVSEVATNGLTTIQRIINIPNELHPETTDLIAKFAEAMAVKLRRSEIKYGYSNGWKSSEWIDECRENLIEHLEKGDPIDVANYCSFLWFHGESTKF